MYHERSTWLASLLLSLTLLLLLSPPAKGAGAAVPRYRVTVRPEMELLAGVLAQTTWVEGNGPSGEGNEYYRALREYLAPYGDHQAVRLAQQLTNQGFTYDAPPGFILHLGPLPDLALEHEYSTDLVQRAGGRERLEEFRLALRDLARESDFQRFVAQWQPEYAAWSRIRGFDGDRVVAWLEGFFQTSGQEFAVVMAPAMFPGGGYGPSVQTKDGRTLVYQVIRAEASGTGPPAFPAGISVMELTLHEWGHSFVNPAVEAHAERLGAMDRFFQPVADRMRQQAYGNAQTFWNEQVLRGVTSLALEELYGPTVAHLSTLNHERRGFYLTRQVVEALREYRRDQAQHTEFSAYLPRLLEALEPVQPESALAQAQNRVKWAVGLPMLPLLLVLVLPAAGIAWWRRRRAQTAR